MDVVNVIITVLAVNLVVAQQEQEIALDVFENQQDGHFIANIAEESGILQNIPDNERQDARFTFLNENPSTPYFAIELISGNLTTSSNMIDRESVCKFKVVCIMTFDVAVQAKTFFSAIPVSVNILDLNDNAPVFPKESISKNISEKETVGTEFRIDSATDEDTTGNNAVITYTLEQSEGIFELVSKREPNTQANELYLRLIRLLDREDRTSHVIRVIAVDGGDPVLQGVLTITVNVMDENDNPPVFIPSNYNITIDENVQLNSVILSLTATDLDFQENARVSFKFRERQPDIDTILNTFAINESTGGVSVIKNLIYEPKDHYEFSVEAFDHGEHPQKGFANVTVNVRDVGNNRPVIHLNLLSPGNIGFVNVSENEPVGFFVAHLNVEDTDKGLNGDVTCYVLNELFKLENFSGRGYKVVTDRELDREVLDTHNVTVACSDKGTPSLSSSASFLVRVTDVNDNSPVFLRDVYSVAMTENNEVLDDVTQVIATDKDIGDNKLIEYILHEDSGDMFLINNSTGFIFANKSFDRETDPYIVFRVLAVDHGKTNRTGTATISMTVLDQNDNAPYMVPVRPELHVQENQAANTTVGVLAGKDDDLGENGQFTFAFASSELTYPFQLLPNGELRTTEPLDREKKARYEIPITISDKGNPVLSNNQYVTIFVGDENDNKPQVSFPNEINNTAEFLYPVQDYNVVTAVVARDLDEGENASLSYSIVGGNELGIFEIDPTLGEISVKKIIDLHEDIVIILTIRVSDTAIVPKSTTVTLHIELVYANGTGEPSTGDDDSSKYIIISVVVVITTAVFAIAIVGVILFLRGMDRRKGNSEDGVGYSDSGISSRTGSDGFPVSGDSGSDVDKQRKKEVSFTLDFSLDGLGGGRTAESSTDDLYMQKRFYDAPNVQIPNPQFPIQSQEKIDGHMKALKLQQYLWEAKSRDWDTPNMQIQQQQPPIGDSESETSRETIGDSGRGGSEDDMSTSSPINEDKRSFNYQEPRTNMKRVSFGPRDYNSRLQREVKQTAPVHRNTMAPPPRPPPYRNTSMSNNKTYLLDNIPNNSSVIKSRQTLSPRNPYDNTNTDPWRDLYQHSAIRRGRHDSCSSIRSGDDDGGSTTTSGSYTLDQDEIDIEMYKRQADLVV